MTKAPPQTWLQARWQGVSRVDRVIRYVVIHTAETPEMGNSAEGVARYFAGGTVKASAHYCVDNNSIVQCVGDHRVAFAAPGCNANGLQIELAGRAMQTALNWADAYSLAELSLAADLVAHLCVEFHIPVKYARALDLTADKILPIAKQGGITTHVEVNKAFHRSTHTDPGPNFPMSWFLGEVGKRVTA